MGDLVRRLGDDHSCITVERIAVFTSMIVVGSKPAF
jgi:hypothetical protein